MSDTDAIHRFTEVRNRAARQHIHLNFEGKRVMIRERRLAVTVHRTLGRAIRCRVNFHLVYQPTSTNAEPTAVRSRCHKSMIEVNRERYAAWACGSRSSPPSL